MGALVVPVALAMISKEGTSETLGIKRGIDTP
jgi:hypothetical protein